MSDDPYADFAERYDLFFDAWGTYDSTVEAFFHQLVSEYRIHRVLDCACGTGADLPLMLSLGCAVEGSDLSEAMLAQARRNLARQGLSVPLKQADYRTLPQHYTEPFDAVLCLSSSILHMPNEDEALRAFESMRAVLRPGGILVMTQGTSDRQWREKPRFLLAFNRPERVRLFVIDYLGQGARYNIVDITREEGPEALQVWSTDYPHVLLHDDYARLLPAAGFSPVHFYGSYHRDPYDPGTSRRLITVAVRSIGSDASRSQIGRP